MRQVIIVFHKSQCLNHQQHPYRHHPTTQTNKQPSKWPKTNLFKMLNLSEKKKEGDEAGCLFCVIDHDCEAASENTVGKKRK